MVLVTLWAASQGMQRISLCGLRILVVKKIEGRKVEARDLIFFLWLAFCHPCMQSQLSFKSKGPMA